MKIILLFLVSLSFPCFSDETCDFRVYREVRDSALYFYESSDKESYQVIHEDFVWEEENSINIGKSEMGIVEEENRFLVESPFLEISAGENYISRIRVEFDQIEKLPPEESSGNKRIYFRARQRYRTSEGERGQYPDIWIKKSCFVQ